MSVFAAPAFYQTVAIKHGVDGAIGGNLNLRGKATQQLLMDLASPPNVASRV